MARDLMDDLYYTSATKGGKIPVKWTAPEVREELVYHLQNTIHLYRSYVAMFHTKLRMFPYTDIMCYYYAALS